MSNYITLWKTWNEIPTYKMPNTDKELSGYSLAGLRTNYFVKPDLMLDAGISAPYSPKNILITHGHSDHIANLPFHLYKQSETSNINIYCPKEIAKLVDNYIVAMFQLSDSDDKMKPSNYTIIGLDVSNSGFFMDIGKAQHKVEIFNCVHSVPCIGYGINGIKNKLKSEYANLSGKEIGTLRKQGVQVTDTLYIPEFVFLGDTTHEIFNQHPEILSYKNVMCECSFIGENDLNNAQDKLHMHWNNLKPFIVSNPNTNFILTHFSRKYTKAEVDEHFERENLPNIKVWCNLV